MKASANLFFMSLPLIGTAQNSQAFLAQGKVECWVKLARFSMRRGYRYNHLDSLEQ